jgi:hypothetical protein
MRGIRAHPCRWQGSEAKDMAGKGLRQDKKKAGGGNPGLRKNSFAFSCWKKTAAGAAV